MTSPYRVNIISFTQTFFRILFSCLAMAWKLGRPILKVALLVFFSSGGSSRRSLFHTEMMNSDSAVTRQTHRWFAERDYYYSKNH